MIQPNLQDNHFPEELQTRKLCKNCYIKGRPLNTKSIYKCIGCSEKYKTEVPLCIDCFSDFHETVIPVCGFGTPNEMKKIYQQYVSGQNDPKSDSNQKKMSQQQPNHAEMDMANTNRGQRILALDQTIKDMHRLFESLARNQDAIPIYKAFNQYLFLTNLKLLKKCQDQRSSSPIVPQDQSKANGFNQEVAKNKSEENNIKGVGEKKEQIKGF